ncbi:MAG: DUF1460 domain-containing protein [Syntrophales bacterium]|nr:DUF1460 domain-containing protein [Syntrophales bacterium]
MTVIQREDVRLFRDYMERVGRRGAGIPPGELLVETGLFFLDYPYEAATLTTTGEETLTVNLRPFDCVTFVETTLALAMTAVRKADMKAFVAHLRRIRYRGGRMRGYASRLHYFSEWLVDNARRGILRDITPALGGTVVAKKIAYMTTHREQYPPLADPFYYRRLAAVEARLSRRAISVLPGACLAEREGMIAQGDIIGIAAARDDLDCLHAGLTVIVAGKPHLLHASAEEERIVVSQATLSRYVTASPQRRGILVGRWEPVVSP